jgi:hypothetical protein
MTERYTRFYTEEFTEVRAIQDTLLLPEGRGSADDGGPRWGEGGGPAASQGWREDPAKAGCFHYGPLWRRSVAVLLREMSLKWLKNIDNKRKAG